MLAAASRQKSQFCLEIVVAVLLLRIFSATESIFQASLHIDRPWCSGNCQHLDSSHPLIRVCNLQPFPKAIKYWRRSIFGLSIATASCQSPDGIFAKFAEKSAAVDRSTYVHSGKIPLLRTCGSCRIDLAMVQISDGSSSSRKTRATVLFFPNHSGTY